MATDIITLAISKTGSIRRRKSSSSGWIDNWLMAQGEDHMLSGYDGDQPYHYRHLLQFTMPNWGAHGGYGISRVLSAKLHVFSTKDHSSFGTQNTTAKNLMVAIKKKASGAWGENGGGEQVWTGAVANGGAEYDPDYRAYGNVKYTPLQETIIDVARLIQAWQPVGVKTKDGHAGKGKSNYGMVLTVAGSTGTDQRKHEAEMASPKHPNAGIHPFLVLEVELKGGPGAVVLGTPNGTIQPGTGMFLTGSTSRADLKIASPWSH